jgi:hypothetical protein
MKAWKIDRLGGNFSFVEATGRSGRIVQTEQHGTHSSQA